MKTIVTLETKEVVLANNALRQYKLIRPNEARAIDNLAVTFWAAHPINKEQCNLAIRAMLLYKSGLDKDAHSDEYISWYNIILEKLREAANALGLDRNEGAEGET